MAEGFSCAELHPSCQGSPLVAQLPRTALYPVTRLVHRADRQSYPLTPLIGSLLGFVAGGYFAFTQSALKALRSDIAQEKASEAAAAAAAAKPATRRRKNKNK